MLPWEQVTRETFAEKSALKISIQFNSSCCKLVLQFCSQSTWFEQFAWTGRREIQRKCVSETYPHRGSLWCGSIFRLAYNPAMRNITTTNQH